MTRYLSVLICVAVFLFAGVSMLAAQDDPLRLDVDTDYTFSEELRFTLHAENAADVNALILNFHHELSPNRYQVNVPFEPGEVISVTHPINVDRLDLRPFSRVTYSWEVETPGNSYYSPEHEFLYEDNRFPWKTMANSGVTAHWLGDGPPILGQGVLDTTGQSLSDLLELLPLERVDPFDVYVYPSSADLRFTIGSTNEGSAPLDRLRLGVLLITAVNEQTVARDVGQSIPYELAHLLLYRVAGSRYEDVPWWLLEGIASNARENENQRQRSVLAAAVDSKDTIPLWQLCEEPQGAADRIELAEAQSASVVRFIIDTQQTGAIPDLLRASLSGLDCEQSVQTVLEVSLDQLESEWLSNTQSVPGSLSLAGSTGIWVLMLLASSTLMIIIYLISRRR